MGLHAFPAGLGAEFRDLRSRNFAKPLAPTDVRGAEPAAHGIATSGLGEIADSGTAVAFSPSGTGPDAGGPAGFL